MSTSLQSEHFTQALYGLLDETFDTVHGIFLDSGTSLFETLATISAAQVKHVAFYLDVLEKSVRTQQYAQQDWDQIWRATSAVTPAEWEAIKTMLRGSYDRIKALINDTTEWPSEREIGGAMATIVHTAYNLGEIRQALCCIR